MNNTAIVRDFTSTYDHHGAIIYTVVTLIFYSLSLFCSLILNIDPDDHYHEKRWAIYQDYQNQTRVLLNQEDILNNLSNPTLRRKFWKIYYGPDEFESRSNQIGLNEQRRLSIVSEHKQRISNEKRRKSCEHQELDQLSQINSLVTYKY